MGRAEDGFGGAKNMRKIWPKMNSSTTMATATEKSNPPTTVRNVMRGCIGFSLEHGGYVQVGGLGYVYEIMMVGCAVVCGGGHGVGGGRRRVLCGAAFALPAKLIPLSFRTALAERNLLIPCSEPAPDRNTPDELTWPTSTLPFPANQQVPHR